MSSTEVYIYDDEGDEDDMKIDCLDLWFQISVLTIT